MAELAKQEKQTAYYINSFITVAIMVVFFLLPPLGCITGLGMKVLGVYISMLYGWSTVGFIWPSFLGIFFLGFSGYDTIPNLINGGFGNPTNVYIFLICLFAFYVTDSGVSDILVKSVIGRDFAKGKPWVITWLFFTATYLVGAFVSMTPACLLVWSVFVKYCKDIGFQKGDRYPIMVIVGIALSGLMGFSLFPFRPPASALVGMITEEGGTVPFVSYVVSAFIMGYGIVMLYWVMCRYVFRPDVELLKKEYDFGAVGKMTPYQTEISAATILLIVLFIIQSAFSSTQVGQFLNKFGTSGVVLGMLMILAFIKKKDGSQFIDIIQGTKLGVIWPVFYMLTVGMTLATALTEDSVGFKAQMIAWLSPVLGGSGGRVLLLFLCAAIAIITTNFMNNMTSALIVFSIGILYCEVTGVSPAMMACLVGVTANVSIVLPSANPIAAVMHGMTDWVTARDIYKYSVPIVLIGLIFTVLYSTLLGNLMF